VQKFRYITHKNLLINSCLICLKCSYNI